MKIWEAGRKAHDGIEFLIRGWEPETGPKAVVALVHGLGEHSGRYEHVAQAMTDAGYALVSFDLRGHGKSGGIRGHFPSLDAVMRDIREFLQYVLGRYGDLPQFLYGHSLGGLLVLAYALRDQPDLQGVIATSPGLRSPLTEQKMKVLLVKALGSIAPTALLPSGLDTSGISQDQDVVQTYLRDPLTHDRVSLAFGKAGLAATDFVWSHADEFRLPLLLMHGTADRVTYSHGSADFADRVAKHNPDVTLKLWDGMYHELHNESVKEQVFRFTIDWMGGHL